MHFIFIRNLSSIDIFPNYRSTKGVKNVAASSHRKSLSKLQDQDPEFYEFLKKEDSELLDFDASDSDSGESDEGDTSEDDGPGHVHKLPEKLEVILNYIHTSNLAETY